MHMHSIDTITEVDEDYVLVRSLMVHTHNSIPMLILHTHNSIPITPASRNSNGTAPMLEQLMK